VTQCLQEFTLLVDTPQPSLQAARPFLTKLKIELTKLDVPTPKEIEQTGEGVNRPAYLAREILELATLYALLTKDEVGFERFINQLKPYYFDYKHLLPLSQRQDPFLGVYLLYLLAENKIADFHTQLELISDHSNRYIHYSVELEQAKMEGSYHKVLTSGHSFPVDYYSQFTQKLIQTARHDIGYSLETAYTSLNLKDAQELLMFPDSSSLQAFIVERNWTVVDNCVLFSSEGDKEATKLDAIALIEQNLSYATELEQII